MALYLMDMEVIFDSSPALFTAAAAIAMDCGETILPITPPAVFAATSRVGANSDLSCGGGLQAREEHVSVGHGAGHEHAIQPMIGDSSGKTGPAAASARAMGVVIPA